MMLIISARLLSGKYFIECFLTILISVASLCSVSALAGRLWGTGAAVVTWAMLVLSAVISHQKKTKNQRFRQSVINTISLIKGQWIKKPPLLKFGILLISFIVLADAFYAGFPAFRVDQWTYHLQVAKYIHEFGHLRLPVFNDHIFFTGAYEFFFILFRYFSQNHTVMQSAANFFNWLVFVSMFTAISFKILNRHRILFTLFVVFSLPDRDMIYDLKSEPHLLLCSLTLLKLLFEIRSKKQKTGPFFLGFLLTAPLAIKVIWLHYAASFGAGIIIFSWIRRKLPLNNLFFMTGALTGLFPTIPIFIKNQMIFSNLIHPVQFLWFRSERWFSGWDSYWLMISGKAVSLATWAENTLMLPVSLSKDLKFYLLPFLISLFFLRKNLFKKPSVHAQFLMVLCSMIFLLWPFLYAHDIYPRFYIPCIAPVIFILAKMIDRLGTSKIIQILLLSPVFLASATEVRVMQLSRHLSDSEQEFYQNMPSPMYERNDQRLIDQHMIRHFPKASPKEYPVVLSDTVSGYFYRGQTLYLSGQDYRWLQLLHQQKYGSPNKSCVWSFLSDHQIHYLYSAELPFKFWPEEFYDAIQKAEIIHDDGKVLYLSDALIRQEEIKCRKPRENIRD